MRMLTNKVTYLSRLLPSPVPRLLLVRFCGATLLEPAFVLLFVWFLNNAAALQ